MSRERRREMVERGHRVLSTVRQCALLGISRSSLNYRRKVTYPEDLAVMKAMEQQYLSTPFYGSRRMRAWLGRQGQTVNRKRVQRVGNQRKWDTFVKERLGRYGSGFGLPQQVVVAFAAS